MNSICSPHKYNFHSAQMEVYETVIISDSMRAWCTTFLHLAGLSHTLYSLFIKLKLIFHPFDLDFHPFNLGFHTFDLGFHPFDLSFHPFDLSLKLSSSTSSTSSTSSSSNMSLFKGTAICYFYIGSSIMIKCFQLYRLHCCVKVFVQVIQFNFCIFC